MRDNRLIRVVLFSLLIFIVLIISFAVSQPDGRLHLVFCDVGQGDAIYIKFPDGRDALVDGGPNKAVLNCLGKHMAFWDRRIELVVLTHPQADHLNGLLDVFERYKVDLFLAPPVGNTTKGYKRLEELVKEKGIRVKNVYKGDKVKISNPKQQISNNFQFSIFNFQKKSKLRITNYELQDNKAGARIASPVFLNVLWPEKKWVVSKVQTDKRFNIEDHVDKNITPFEEGVLGVWSWHSDLNDFSIILELSFGEFEALLTGDAEGKILERIGAVPNLQVLKVPHHGAVRAFSESRGQGAQVGQKLKAKLAVISVGEGNRYGHPSEQTLRLLREIGTKILRTDIDGEIEVVTDGKVWQVLPGFTD